MPKKNTEELIHEPVLVDADERSGKYDKPEIYAYIVENRNKDKSWSEIAQGIEERGYGSMTPDTASKLWSKALARSIVIHNTAQEQFDDFSSELQKMYSKAIAVLSRHIDILDKIYTEFETSDMETMQKYLMYIKLAPQIKMTADTILSYLREYKDGQDKLITEKKNEVWSASEMIEYINKYLKTLEKSGQVKILDPALK